MDMETNHQILNGAALKQIYVGGWITEQVLTDLGHQQSTSMLVRSFEIYFFKAVDSLVPLYGSLSTDQRDRLKIGFIGGRITGRKPNEFVDTFMLKEFTESKNANGYWAVFQSAFIYAVASAYGSQIKRSFMKATNEWLPTEREKLEMMMSGTINGKYLYGSKSHAAKYSDAEYIQYMNQDHTILANFVKSKNRFKNKQILSLMGYLINPALTEEQS